MKVFNDLKTRGVSDILIAVTDGLKGIGEPFHPDWTKWFKAVAERVSEYREQFPHLFEPTEGNSELVAKCEAEWKRQ